MIKRHIPNSITCCNLICGCIAVGSAYYGQYHYTVAMIVLGAVFDFFDGMVARALGVSSPIGKELDSLADMVSFGLVPAVAMFSWYNQAPQLSQLSDCVIGWGAYLTLIIVAFSALRLAKFNIDDTQHTEFCGLPTPANGLFCLSLAMLAQSGNITFAKEIILLTSIIMACLLISPIRMFALKFKGFGWSGNELRYSFLVACVVLIAAFTKYAIPSIILIYIVISTLRWLISSRKA